jgi:hypothetical protein
MFFLFEDSSQQVSISGDFLHRSLSDFSPSLFPLYPHSIFIAVCLSSGTPLDSIRISGVAICDLPLNWYSHAILIDFRLSEPLLFSHFNLFSNHFISEFMLWYFPYIHLLRKPVSVTNISLYTGVIIWQQESKHKRHITRTLITILCQITDLSLLAILSPHMTPSAYVIWKQQVFKMATTMQSCTKTKMRSVNRFLEAGGIEHAEICRRISPHSPCEYHLFWSLKYSLRLSNFSPSEEVKVAVHEWLQHRPLKFSQESKC